MKIFLNLLVVSWLTCIASKAEILLGKELQKDLPEAVKEIDFEELKTARQLTLEEAINHGDTFLKQTFGKDFKPKIFHVCLSAESVKGGKIWCWSIAYQHPGDGDFDEDRVFLIYLSTTGKPLMKVMEK